jgi:hypothetical protein
VNAAPLRSSFAFGTRSFLKLLRVMENRASGAVQ